MAYLVRSLTVLIGLFCSLFGTLLVWTLSMMTPSNMLKADATHRTECSDLSDLSAGHRRGRRGEEDSEHGVRPPQASKRPWTHCGGPTELPVESCPRRPDT